MENLQQPEFKNIYNDENPEENSGWGTFIQTVILYIAAIGKTAIIFLIGVFFASMSIKLLGSNAYLALLFMAVIIVVGICLENKIQGYIQSQNKDDNQTINE